MASDEVVVDVSQDWANACYVQERFMQSPVATIHAFSYTGRCRQLRALGGDCYGFMPLPHNRLALAIGDASGKGLAAALMISNVQSSLRTAASFAADDAVAVVAAVNRQVHASSPADRFATLFYGVFEGTSRTLRYVNAGHNPPILIRRDHSITQFEASGPPVGIFCDSTYQESAIHLRTGDLVVAYTDGIVEATNPAGEEWGAAGIITAVAKSNARYPDDIVDAIFASLDKFSCGCQFDDATATVLCVD
jgi:phosphoserine phosphatase RsbU/P